MRNNPINKVGNNLGKRLSCGILLPIALMIHLPVFATTNSANVKHHAITEPINEKSSAYHCNITNELTCSNISGVSWSKSGFSDVSRILQDDKRVYLSQNTQTSSFDIQTGKLLWQSRAQDPSHYFYPALEKSPLFENSLYLAQSNGIIEKRSAKTGALLWSKKLSEGWVYPPVILENGLITAGQNRTLWHIDKQTGSVLNNFDLSQELVAPLVLSHSHNRNGLIIASTFDNKITAFALDALDAQQGRQKQGKQIKPQWELTLNAPVFSFESANATLIAAGMDGSLTAIDVNTGRTQWQARAHQNARFWNLLSKNSLYSLSESGNLFRLDSRSGKIKSSLQLSGRYDRAPILQGKVLALYDTRNFVQRINVDALSKN